ncbi:MAG: hypothetical protein ACRDQZ_09710 [Mycobacteriales bacterium]
MSGRSGALSKEELGALVRAGRVRGPAGTLKRLAKAGSTHTRRDGERPLAVTATWDGHALVLAWPARLYSESNQRDTWEHMSRKKAQRAAARAILAPRIQGMTLPATITITRIGKRLMDSDNIHGACKHVRDGIADAFGVDDGDPGYTWVVAQRIGQDYGVEVRIEVASIKAAE